MTNIVNNLLATKILFLLVTPFEKTNAFKTGVIDASGNILVPVEKRTQEQNQSYDMLDRIVFSLKRLLAKIPGGSSKLASLTAAYWLIKENLYSNRDITEDELLEVIYQINNGLHLVEEEIEIKLFLEDGEGGIANITGTNVSTDIPLKPLIKKVLKRKKPILTGVTNG